MKILSLRIIAPITVLALALSFAPQTAAEDAAASQLDTSKARRYLGEWLLTINFGGQNRHLILTFRDSSGKLGATIRSPAAPQPQIIDDITQVSRGLRLKFLQTIGETETPMTLDVRLERNKLNGSITDEGGSFSAQVNGEKGGKVPGRALVQFDGSKVKATFGGLKVGSKDHDAFKQVKDGEVFEFVYSRATKFFTDVDLKFGDVLIKTENVAPNYPGVYSLWMKKSGDEWRLVFNEEADVWGTQHDASKDIAEIPLTLSKSEEKADKFVVDIDKNGSGGTIRLAWGNDQWTADFALAN